MLVFLPGEREIREAAEALRKHHPAGAEILPLYARLSAEEQERVFKPSSRVTARRARDQRRRNIADSAGYSLRRRHRACAREAVLVPEQGRAVADRADLAERRPTNARAVAAASPTAFASGSTAKTTTQSVRALPIRRCSDLPWPA